MSKAIIKGMETIFFTKEEAALLPNDEREPFDLVFPYVEELASYLNVKTPDIAFTRKMRDEDYVTVKSGQLTTPKDEPKLKNALLTLSWEHIEEFYLEGVIAHEMRHLWQEVYHPELLSVKAKGFKDSLYNDAEIDADGFAIAYLCNYFSNMHEDKADKILCPEEKKHYPKAYFKRLERAKAIPAEMAAFWEEIRKKKTEDAPQKLSPIKRFLKKIFG